VGAFSFYPTKNMTTGEGGMITTSDPGVAERARWLRNQGMSERYVHPIAGLNERMTEIEGAIGLIQLEKLPAWTERRRAIAADYASRLDPRLGLPVEREDATHVYHQYTITPPDRDSVRAALRDAGIGHDVYYPLATHQQSAYTGPTYELPVTEEMVGRVLSIPVRPDLGGEEVDFIVETLNGALG
jgi:dTDP-4-amino-4,6-dideoxygalactose transaminase